MVSSGTTAKATDGNDAVTLLPISSNGQEWDLTILNEGSVAGYFSVDAGTTWLRLPAGPASITGRYTITGDVQIKRIEDGTDLAGVWGWADAK